jgi:DNA-binding protein HU-beta
MFTKGKQVNKSQFIDALAARFEGNRKQAADALDAVLSTITREVAKGEKVAITGFGSFEKRVRDARWVRNPRTGERIKAKKTAIPKFSAGADLKAVVSGAKKLPKQTVSAATDRARAAAGRPATKKASATKATAKKAPASKTTAKKAPASRSTAKKAPAKKTAAKSTAKKTSTAKRAPAKTSTAKRTPAKTSAAKKAPAKKTSTARKAPARKTSTARKAPARTSTAKRTAKKS